MHLLNFNNVFCHYNLEKYNDSDILTDNLGGIIHTIIFFFKLINLFIFGCVGSSFLCEGFL